MSYETWREKVLSRPGAAERIAELEQQMLLAHGLRSARKKARISQKELARRMGVSQPRIVAIERAEDINISTLTRYAAAIGARPKIELVLGEEEIPVLTGTNP